jgi:DNA-binding response OmpR family regulator
MRDKMYKVLVIDSDFSSATKIASALTKSGFALMVALCESVGIGMAEERSPDAVIVRDSPPQLNGSKLCQQIRHLFDLPLILLGDKSEIEVYSPNLEIPMDWDYYMRLPINYEELASRVKVLLWRYGKSELPYKNRGEG